VRERGQPLQRDRPGGKRVAGRRQPNHPVLVQRHRADLGSQVVDDPQVEVHLPIAQGRQVLVPLGAEPQGDPGRLSVQSGQQRRRELGDEGVGGAEREPSFQLGGVERPAGLEQPATAGDHPVHLVLDRQRVRGRDEPSARADQDRIAECLANPGQRPAGGGDGEM
jgi:hypothetical protein